MRRDPNAARLLEILVGIFFVVFTAAACGRDKRPGEEGIKIAVFQIVEYDLIANMRRAFADEIQKSELAKKKKITILPHKDAHNDVNLVNQISDQIIADKPDLIYVLGTPAAQAVVQRTTTIPIVQGAVTDPVAAKMAVSWESSGRNYAASTDFPPVDATFEYVKKILPKVRTIGAIYSSGEINSQALMTRVRPVCEKLGYRLVERPVTGTAEVSSAATALIGKADLIYVTTDNTIHAALPTLLQVARDNKVPVITNTQEAAKEGALFALGASYEELSRIAARIAVRILSGESPARIPIAFIENPELYWNQGTAEMLRIKLPAEVEAKVHTWFRDGKQIQKP